MYRDPECWDDVLKIRRIHGLCENSEIACTYGDQDGLPFAEFYFKCAKHTSEGEKDFAAPLNLIKRNIKNIPCLACTDVSDPVLVFSCDAGHVTCLDCFRTYCLSRLMERQFIPHPDFGYTLSCPAGCENSFINEVHHFKLLTKEQYERYQRFATEEYVLQAGGVLCPQPGCGMGLLVDDDCTKVQCLNGCGVRFHKNIPGNTYQFLIYSYLSLQYVFCKKCLQGYHIGDCLADGSTSIDVGSCQYSVDPEVNEPHPSISVN